MPSIDQQSLSPEQRATLLDVARKSILHGLNAGSSLTVDPQDYDESLRLPRATFVTLNIGDQLRGCIGHLQAIQSLVQDVAENAWAAAFRDPRFTPLSAEEYPELDIHISVLSPAEQMNFSSQEELLSQIRPGEDGLILEDGNHRGTFLPSVWESLPEKHEFLAHLKLKAGLPVDHWSDSVRVSRYTTESFS